MMASSLFLAFLTGHPALPGRSVGVAPISCVATLRAVAIAAKIRPTIFDSAFAGFTLDSTILVSRQRQPEFTTPIWDYLAVLVDSERVADGQQRLKAWDSVLAAVESTYGVDRHVVVAVWGVETDFGRLIGNRPLIRALATGACIGTRQIFYRDQLIAALRILQAGDYRPDQLIGSWAGAFGQTQFMPTTYLTRAVDQDGDGRRDIISSAPDALGSAANYLRKAGWIRGARWGVEVRLPPKYRGPAGRATRRSVAAWSSLGIRQLDGHRLVGSDTTALFLPAGRKGPAFLVGPNFEAIYSYNAAESYALAIAHLADRIAGKGPFAAPWPTDDRGISRAERRELQTRLLARGYDVGVADGTLGSRTRGAIKAFQKAAGLPVDGRAGGRTLDRLRQPAEREDSAAGPGPDRLGARWRLTGGPENAR